MPDFVDSLYVATIPVVGCALGAFNVNLDLATNLRLSECQQWSHLTNKITSYVDILAGDLRAVPADHTAARGLGVAALEVKVGGPLPVVHAPVSHIVDAVAVELHMYG